ncbi:MAG: putative DNA binding domain-containing protein [Actinomycetota bacterium]|nr:putative DNA binding domain-containing protein [Actinomycetota bacterium]
MDRDEIARLIADRESDRVERKASAAESDRICEAICAFANDLPGHRQPGVVVVGIDNGGQPTGLSVDDKLLLRLASLRDNDKIYPFPSIQVEPVDVADGVVAVVVVQPSDAPPVQFRGRTWIRVGPRRAIATPEEEARLAERRRHSALPFDARAVAGATLGDLSLDRLREELLPQLVAPEILEANRRSIEQQLAGLRLTDIEGVPTPSGLLFSGKDPLSFLPGAVIQFLRIEGASLDAPVRSAHRLTGPLPDALRELEEVIRANIDTAVSFADHAREIRRPNLPLAAVQQVVRNAVMHRTYEATNAPIRVTWFDDRVEVQSPGGPYGVVSVAAFGTPGLTDYRNPTVAGMLAQLGFVQRFGVGIPTAQARMTENGNPPLELDATATHVNVIMRMIR